MNHFTGRLGHESIIYHLLCSRSHIQTNVRFVQTIFHSVCI